MPIRKNGYCRFPRLIWPEQNVAKTILTNRWNLRFSIGVMTGHYSISSKVIDWSNWGITFLEILASFLRSRFITDLSWLNNIYCAYWEMFGLHLLNIVLKNFWNLVMVSRMHNWARRRVCPMYVSILLVIHIFPSRRQLFKII